MRIFQRHAILFLTSFSCAAVILSCAPAHKASTTDNRLDIEFEGPWIFYMEQNFNSTGGQALVAMYPGVPGHASPTFTTGDGGTIVPGVYCVEFDNKCAPANTMPLDNDGYPDPGWLIRKKPTSWDWVPPSSTAYFLILPVPDSVSAYGQYDLQFQQTLPTSTNKMPTLVAEPARNLGIHLHYANGPSSTGTRLHLVAESGCSRPSGVVVCTAGSSLIDQDNTGTLQITIKSTDHPPDTQCPYHEHLAYFTMLRFFDSGLTANSDSAFMGPLTSDNLLNSDGACHCDPQRDPTQDNPPHSCDDSEIMARKMAKPMPPADIPKMLGSFVDSLDKLRLSEKQQKAISLTALKQLDAGLDHKFIRKSQLTELLAVLGQSENGINGILHQHSQVAKPATQESKPSRMALRQALLQEKRLANDVGPFLLVTGKDCRTGAILIR